METVTACNTITVIGARILAPGDAAIRAGTSVTFFDGFAVATATELVVVIESALGCDPTVDADLDGVDQCLDCDETDANNWDSCGSCVDDDGDSAWIGCDAYVTLGGPDCDDGDTARKPGLAETCNQLDDDCNGLVDECLICPGPGTSEVVDCWLCPLPRGPGISR